MSSFTLDQEQVGLLNWSLNLAIMVAKWHGDQTRANKLQQTLDAVARIKSHSDNGQLAPDYDTVGEVYAPDLARLRGQSIE